MRVFKVGDRVRNIHQGWTGTIDSVGVADDLTYAAYDDTGKYHGQLLEHSLSLIDSHSQRKSMGLRILLEIEGEYAKECIETFSCDLCYAEREHMLRLAVFWLNVPIAQGDFCSFECALKALQRSENTAMPGIPRKKVAPG